MKGEVGVDVGATIAWGCAGGDEGKSYQPPLSSAAKPLITPLEKVGGMSSDLPPQGLQDACGSLLPVSGR